MQHHRKLLCTMLLVSVGSVVVLLSVGILLLAIIFRQFLPLISHAPDILGFGGTKRYLILFQNNMELRPGGGFIGSFATITVTNGKFGPLEVHNTYDADGQLHQHVEPYYIGRRFIQVHLYMRDSNFDVDFVKSAEKVAYMYHLETGHSADGVIAIDFSYLQNVVALLSPIYVWQYNQTVTGKNVFYLTEYHADRYSFYGSTQKQDFIHALYESMLLKMKSHKFFYALGILQQTIQAIQQKHILFASLNTKIQNILTPIGISSALYDPRLTQKGTINDFLGLNEANIGVNKTNYYLKRSITHQVTIASTGNVQEVLTLSYANPVPKEEWPVGRYIVYIRLILPHNASLTSVAIDGKAQHMVSAITDFRTYEAPGFTPPAGLEVDRSEEEGKTLYGFRTLISYHSSQIVKIGYTLAQRADIHAPRLLYNLFLFKQPGTINDPYILSFLYPSQFLATDLPPHAIKIQQNNVVYTSSLLTDQHITMALSQR